MKQSVLQNDQEILAGSGCARKFALRELRSNHLSKLRISNSRIFLGVQDFDDVGAFELTNDTLLVQSVDIIASLPLQPHDFGAICAAHCLSDLYAKGVTPQTALSIFFDSFSPYDPDRINGIFSGITDKLNQAGVALIGGHTINEQSLYCGLAVSGIIEKKWIIKKSGVHPGDILLLTKPIGTGIISIATRHGILKKFPPKVIDSMARLNDFILRLAKKDYVHASTDISGAGLAGSLYEIANQNSVKMIVNATKVPYYEEAVDHARFMEEDGALLNRDYVKGSIKFKEEISSEYHNLFYDPQTSGGLLLVVAPSALDQVIDRLDGEGLLPEKLVIGEIIDKGKPEVIVV